MIVRTIEAIICFGGTNVCTMFYV